jgi:FHS family L-fucose permease-like MFS transporter
MTDRPAPLLWVLFLAYFTFGMITNILGVIIPEVIKEYQLSLFTAGILPLAFYLAYGVCSIPTGLLMDRLGARPMVLVGVLLMALGCLTVAWARSYPLMVAMIFTVGVGVTVLQTAGNPLIQHLDRVENYHRNLTLTIGFCGIGAFLGPFILALFTGTGQPWQMLYIFFAVLSLFLLALLVLSRFPPRPAESASQVRLSHYARLLLNPLVLFYSLGIFCYVGAEVGTASWIVKFFERVHGLHVEVSPVQGTSLLRQVLPTLPALVVALFWGLQGTGRLVSGAVLNRFGSRRILRLYSFLALASLLVAAFGPQKATVVGFAACGFFTSVLFTLIFSGTINSFTENHGAISGLLCTACVGGAVMPPLVGLVGDHFGLRAAMLVPLSCFAYVFGLAMLSRAKYE